MCITTVHAESTKGLMDKYSSTLSTVSSTGGQCSHNEARSCWECGSSRMAGQAQQQPLPEETSSGQLGEEGPLQSVNITY